MWIPVLVPVICVAVLLVVLGAIALVRNVGAADERANRLLERQRAQERARTSDPAGFYLLTGAPRRQDHQSS